LTSKSDERDLSEGWIGVVPISKDGFHLKFGGGDTIVEWAVHLRRFDENRTLDRLVKRNELNLEIIAKLAGVVAASHRRAPIISGANAGQALQRQIEETLISLEAAPEIFAAQAVVGLRQAMQQAFARLAPLLSERENQGQVRRCYGDLHLRNIVLIECLMRSNSTRRSRVRRALRSRVSSDGPVDTRIEEPREIAQAGKRPLEVARLTR
jgi:uncharacterized protein